MAMSALLQTAVATVQSGGPTWQNLAVTAGGILQAIVLYWMKALHDEQRIRAAKVEVLERLMTEMATHIGINGNGMLSAMDAIKEEMQGMRRDVASALQQLAEQRGEQRGAQQHTRHMRES